MIRKHGITPHIRAHWPSKLIISWKRMGIVYAGKDDHIKTLIDDSLYIYIYIYVYMTANP